MDLNNCTFHWFSWSSVHGETSNSGRPTFWISSRLLSGRSLPHLKGRNKKEKLVLGYHSSTCTFWLNYVLLLGTGWKIKAIKAQTSVWLEMTFPPQKDTDEKSHCTVRPWNPFWPIGAWILSFLVGRTEKRERHAPHKKNLFYSGKKGVAGLQGYGDIWD